QAAHAMTFLDLLRAIEEAGLPVGVREHMAVSRLLARTDLTDPDTIKASLAALLARNPQEAALVRDTFDRFCRTHVAPAVEPPAAEERRPPFMARLRVRWALWGAAALVGLLLLPVLSLAWRLI